jgi:multiple sugar transport system permease protein
MAKAQPAGFWKRNQLNLCPLAVPGPRRDHVPDLCPDPHRPVDLDQLLRLGWPGPKTWIGLGNYVELLDDDTFYTALWNNVLWLVLYLLAIPMGLAVALFLNQT